MYQVLRGNKLEEGVKRETIAVLFILLFMYSISITFVPHIIENVCI